MAERPPPDPALITEVLKYAIASAGDMTDLAAWRGRLAVLIPEIVATIGEGSREREQVTAMLSSPKLIGEYRGFKLHDGSHRAIVSFMPDHRTEEETVWSERTDTPHGAAQLGILRTLPHGCRILIWKRTRQIEQNKKVRDMLHISRVDADPDSRPSAPAADRAETPPTDTPPSVGGPNLPGPSLQVAIERLNGRQKVQVIKWAAQEAGIPSISADDLTVEQKDSILAYIELMLAGMAGQEG